MDLQLFEGLVDRMNKFEEVMTKKRSSSPAKGKSNNSDEEFEEDGSPSSIKKGEEPGFDIGEDSEEMRKQSEAMDALRKKIDDQDSKFQQMIEKMQVQINDQHFEAKKTANDQLQKLEKIEGDFQSYKKMMDEDDGAGGGGGTKASAQQRRHNDEMSARMQAAEDELEKLNKLDFRIKSEYISKPYQYIDRVKKELMKENSDIRKVIMQNNDKYITRISTTEHKVNKVLTDTESLLHQYQKNVKTLTGNLESTKTFRE